MASLTRSKLKLEYFAKEGISAIYGISAYLLDASIQVKKDKTLREIRSRLENKFLGSLLNFHQPRTTVIFPLYFPVYFLCSHSGHTSEGMPEFLAVGQQELLFFLVLSFIVR